MKKKQLFAYAMSGEAPHSFPPTFFALSERAKR